MPTATPTRESLGRLAAARPVVELATAIEKHGAATASGLWGSSVGAVAATLHSSMRRPVLLVCGHIDESDDIADDIELFLGARPDVLPALELSGALGSASEEQVANRMQLVARLAGMDEDHSRDPAAKATAPKDLPFIVAPVQALMQPVPSKNQLDQLIRTIRKGQSLEPEKLIVWLSEHGYNRLDQVEVPGDFAVRGGIVDVYIPGEFEQAGDQVGLTVRFDFFGDEVESIRTFDLSTLGSGQTLDQVRLIDLRGKFDDYESTLLLGHLPENTLVVLWAPLEIAEQAKSYLDRLPESVKGIYPLAAILRAAERFARVELSQFDSAGVAIQSLVDKHRDIPRVRLPIRSIQKFETVAKEALKELAEIASTADVTVFCENDGERARFTELLDADVPGLRKKLRLELGYLHHGFIWGEHAESDEAATERGGKSAIGNGQSAVPTLAFVAHHELFHRYEQRRRVKKVINSRPVDSFLDLKVGDYVVHVAHGIAKFTGIQIVEKDGKKEEYLTLRFAENASLHVPASRINLIQKYIGGFSGHPQLSRLGSGAWEKQKQRVSEAVMDLAAEMIEVQAAREAETGTAFPPDTEWQMEFEAEFPYEPTDDQVTAADEIKKDMERPRPMDRLLCGDVGYGKTEMAMRAAFKAVEAGKQVAVLVPTTVLAEQHYRSFKERMASYPFAIDSISRWKTHREQKEIVKRVSAGEIDVLIGTHRLISEDIKFKDLGLVVIDEEQRFGVTHKERLKKVRKTVDVLTMSATPIPRTLHMSMVGVRDISSLTTAPQDRRSVVTEVMQYDPNRIKLAIYRELQRDGQVYFVHNRVNSILETAQEIQQLVPEARILVGHGQMGEGELEDIMLKFIRHEADVLVCTTIIESGLDIPNANTIVIDNADRFGLSELHQLRGRVGRWKNRAYCYLLLPADRPVTPIAAKRLKAIEEYSHLGSGFKIAMRDLELRGAGNILGPEQSGHIATVGYEMYCQLLEEAVRQLKNAPRPTMPEAHVDIGLSAFIPKEYIPADRQRMDVYRRLTRTSDLQNLADLQKNLNDAFGEPPRQVLLLFALTELRLLAGHFGIEKVVKHPPDVVLTVRDAAKAQYGMAGAPGTLRLVDEKTVYYRPPAVFLEPDTMLMMMRNLLKAAHERQERGEPAPEIKPPPPEVLKASPGGIRTLRAIPSKDTGVAKPKETAKPLPPKIASQLEKLVSLKDAGILSDAEFEAARKRLLASA
ncbi:MAG: transcription-repair coupling factor [Phycisphaerae bacterium]|nr:transcription-repair coupling factor [Tepidisphaeraceae bacterium]